MRKVRIFLVILVLLATSVLAEVNNYYTLEIFYEKGNLSLKGIDVGPSKEGLNSQKGNYIAEIVSDENEILNITFFSIPLKLFFEHQYQNQLRGGGSLELEETEVTFNLPYYNNAREINIYDWDLIKRLQIDVSPYSLKKSRTTSEEKPGVQDIKSKQQELQLDNENMEIKDKEPPLVFIILIFSSALLFLIILILLIIIRKKKRS